MPGKPLRWRRSGKPWRGETAAWLQRRRKAQPIAVLHQSSDGLSSHESVLICRACLYFAPYSVIINFEKDRLY